MADQIDDLVEVYSACVKRLDAQQPPLKYREMHSATRGFMALSAENNARYAAAIRTGKRQAADRVFRESFKKEKAAAKRWKAAADKLGEPVPAFDALLKEYEAGPD